MQNENNLKKNRGPGSTPGTAAKPSNKTVKTATESKPKKPLSQELAVCLTEQEALLAGAAIARLLATEPLPVTVRIDYQELAGRLERLINRRFRETGSAGCCVNFTGRYYFNPFGPEIDAA